MCNIGLFVWVAHYLFIFAIIVIIYTFLMSIKASLVHRFVFVCFFAGTELRTEGT